MDLSNKLYIVIALSIAIFLFGFALFLSYFLGNWIAFILMVVICAGLSLFTAYLASVFTTITPIEFGRKGIVIAACIFFTLCVFILALLLASFPGDIIALLVGFGVGDIIALLMVYLLFREIIPLKRTPKIEYVVIFLIFLFGILIIQAFFLDDLIGILIVIGIGLAWYIFIFLFIQFLIS
jgi:MFS family permease